MLWHWYVLLLSLSLSLSLSRVRWMKSIELTIVGIGRAHLRAQVLVSAVCRWRRRACEAVQAR